MERNIFDDYDFEKYVKYVRACIMVFGPISKKDIYYWTEYYSKGKLEKVDKSIINHILKLLVQQKDVIKLKNGYAYHDFSEQIKEIFGDVSDEFDNKIFENEDEFLKYQNYMDIHGFKPFDNLVYFFNKKNINDELTRAKIMSIPYLSANYSSIDYFLKEGGFKLNNNDYDKLLELLDEIGTNLPRPYLNGHSLGELGQQLVSEVNEFEKSDEKTRINLVKSFYVDKSTYKECINQAIEFKKSNLFLEFDLDLLFEFIVNDIPYLCSFDIGDKKNPLINIFRDDSEFLSLLNLERDNIGFYPDLIFRISFLSVNFEKRSSIYIDTIRQECIKNGYPKTPLLVEFNIGESPKLISGKYLDVLSGILRQFKKLSDFSKKSNAFKEHILSNDIDGITQVYETKNGFEFGTRNIDLSGAGYIKEIDFGEIEPNLIHNIREYKKSEISIGIFYLDDKSVKKPLTVVFLDSHTNEVLCSHKFYDNKYDNFNKVILTMFDEIKIYPERIFVNNYGCGDMLQDIIMKLRIENVEVDEEINEVYMQLQYELPSEIIVS